MVIFKYLILLMHDLSPKPDMTYKWPSIHKVSTLNVATKMNQMDIMLCKTIFKEIELNNDYIVAKIISEYHTIFV